MESILGTQYTYLEHGHRTSNKCKSRNLKQMQTKFSQSGGCNYCQPKQLSPYNRYDRVPFKSQDALAQNILSVIKHFRTT